MPTKKVQKKQNSAAVLTVHDAPRMTTQGRKAVASWLVRQAKFLVKDGTKLAKRFTARYLY